MSIKFIFLLIFLIFLSFISILIDIGISYIFLLLTFIILIFKYKKDRVNVIKLSIILLLIFIVITVYSYHKNNVAFKNVNKIIKVVNNIRDSIKNSITGEWKSNDKTLILLSNNIYYYYPTSDKSIYYKGEYKIDRKYMVDDNFDYYISFNNNYKYINTTYVKDYELFNNTIIFKINKDYKKMELKLKESLILERFEE